MAVWKGFPISNACHPNPIHRHMYTCAYTPAMEQWRCLSCVITEGLKWDTTMLVPFHAPPLGILVGV